MDDLHQRWLWRLLQGVVMLLVLGGFIYLAYDSSRVEPVVSPSETDGGTKNLKDMTATTTTTRIEPLISDGKERQHLDVLYISRQSFDSANATLPSFDRPATLLAALSSAEILAKYHIVVVDGVRFDSTSIVNEPVAGSLITVAERLDGGKWQDSFVFCAVNTSSVNSRVEFEVEADLRQRLLVRLVDQRTVFVVPLRRVSVLPMARRNTTTEEERLRRPSYENLLEQIQQLNDDYSGGDHGPVTVLLAASRSNYDEREVFVRQVINETKQHRFVLVNSSSRNRTVSDRLLALAILSTDKPLPSKVSSRSMIRLLVRESRKTVKMLRDYRADAIRLEEIVSSANAV